jgi:hypothetical protein
VSAPPIVRGFRQILLWPLRLVPEPGEAHARPWERLGSDSPWREVADEIASGVAVHERHYSEFVAFLPYVQRFLYGEGRRAGAAVQRASPMRVFRRADVAAARVSIRAGEAPLTLRVQHVDLVFFYDLDLVLLIVEVAGDELPLPLVQDLMYRFGRGYPGGWDADGLALHCLHEFDWLGADGQPLVRSDACERERFLDFLARHRAPRIAAHWAWLLHPLVPDLSEEAGPLRYRQIEYYRMPTMAWLALDEPRALPRADFVRLAFVTASGGGTLPFAAEALASFEAEYCYDRFWFADGSAPATRYLASGHALVVVGDARSELYGCAERGILAQFRHQQFLLFLIAHVQKAALLMFSDRLVDALEDLDVADAESVKRFKRSIRRSFEGLLRFTHRYWFHEISEQAHVRALFRMTARHLELDALYDEVKSRHADMNAYLDADSIRRQANTVVRLTVVTILGLVGTITTGFLGMNLIAAADDALALRLLAFALVMAGTLALTVFTIARSRRLSDFLDALSNERLGWRAKAGSLLAVFRSN